MSGLHEFVAESNRIEGIHRVTGHEITAHEELLQLPEIKVHDLEHFVKEIAGVPLRDRPGLNVRVGSHLPPGGGPGIRADLELLLADCTTDAFDSPWAAHVAYEKLHPFMDGNGRSGRALWAWMRIREGRDPFVLGALHAMYYEALEAGRP